MPFIAILITSLFGQFFKKTVRFFKMIRIETVLFVLVSICLVLLCGLRGISVGRDTSSYYTMYVDASKWSWNSLTGSWQQGKLDIGFLILEYFFANLLKAPFTVFTIFCAIISIVPVCILIKKYSPNVLLSIILYLLLGLYFFNLSAIRQGLCLGLSSIAILCIEKRKLVLFLIFCALASLFHLSGLVLIPSYFFCKMKVTHFKLLLFISLIFISFLTGKTIFNYITSLYRVNYSTEESPGGFGLYLFVLGIWICSIVFSGNSLNKDSRYRMFFYLIFMFLIVWPFVRFNTSAFRLTYVFQISLIIFIPLLLDNIKDKATLITLAAVIGCVAIYYFIFYVFNDYNMYNHYSLFIN